MLDVWGRERLILADQPITASDGALVVHPAAPVASLAVLPSPGALAAEGGTLSPPRP
ncbi:hypothetical protein [Demequina sp.]|uniref:hypothetical protein n=1 Tax=Demequina sp. TaxID=2050685 RepID=UPI003A8553B2